MGSRTSLVQWGIALIPALLAALCGAQEVEDVGLLAGHAVERRNGRPYVGLPRCWCVRTAGRCI